jgi:hypothetical protein
MALVLELASTSIARADDPPPSATAKIRPVTDRPSTEERWYGYQIVILDAVASAVMFSGLLAYSTCWPRRVAWSEQRIRPDSCLEDTSFALLLTGGIGYAVSGAIVHGAHRQWSKVGYSLGLRLAPVAAGLTLAELTNDNVAGAVAVVGMLGAMAVDSALLAFDTIVVSESIVSVTPLYDPKRQMGAMVVSAHF